MFFLVSKALSFRIEKQNSENISVITFQIFDIKRKCDGEIS